MKRFLINGARSVIRCISALVGLFVFALIGSFIAVMLDRCGIHFFGQHIRLIFWLCGLVGLIFGWKILNRFWKKMLKHPSLRKEGGYRDNYVRKGYFNPDQHLYGQVGGTMGSADFGAGNIDAGMAGELKLAELIDRINAETGGNAYIFRGLHWPGSKDADIDFIIATSRYVNGKVHNDLWLVDAKMWKRGEYIWDGSMCHHVGENGIAKPYHEIKFADAVRGVKQLIHGVFAHADVVIFNSTKCNNHFGAQTKIVTPDDFEKQLRIHLMASASSAVPLSSDIGAKLSGLVKVQL